MYTYINNQFCYSNQPRGRIEMKPQLKDRGSYDILPSQGCRNVRDEYGAVVE
jgi:hypothetical protein